MNVQTSPTSAEGGYRRIESDVVIVGAGPAGSAAATHLAQAGLSVALLEKTDFPRDKVCGDALTPRAVRELHLMGMRPESSESAHTVWHRNRGLRLIGGGHRLEFDWPRVPGIPNYGLTRARMNLDADLAGYAAEAGAQLYTCTQALYPDFDKDGWIHGIMAVDTDKRGRKTTRQTFFAAPVVIAADGVSARMATALGLQRRTDRPMGVAIRTYHHSPRHADDRIESWLELHAPADSETATCAEQTPMTRVGTAEKALPGYGWLFPLGDGTVNIGLGMLDTSPYFGSVDYKQVLTQWLATMGDEWGLTETSQCAPVRSAALPMAFNRTPQVERGLVLIGDAAGMVSPFNGEGIDYAMQSGRIAAEVVSTYWRYPKSAFRARLGEYAHLMERELGTYFTLGRLFAQGIGRPELMRIAVNYGMSSPQIMRFAMKLLANLYVDGQGEQDIYDRIISGLNHLVPRTSTH